MGRGCQSIIRIIRTRSPPPPIERAFNVIPRTVPVLLHFPQDVVPPLDHVVEGVLLRIPEHGNELVVEPVHVEQHQQVVRRGALDYVVQKLPLGQAVQFGVLGDVVD